MKQIVRLTEEDLHRIVKESVNRILNETGKKVTKGKSYWNDSNKRQTNKRQTYEYPYDEMDIKYTGGRPGVMWDADETPLRFKQSKFQ